jgi:hypothetical protein
VGGNDGRAISRFVLVLRRHLFGIGFWCLVFGVWYLQLSDLRLADFQHDIIAFSSRKHQTQNTKHTVIPDIFRFYDT